MYDELSGKFIKSIKEIRKNASAVKLDDNKESVSERLACDLVKGKKYHFVHFIIQKSRDLDNNQCRDSKENCCE